LRSRRCVVIVNALGPLCRGIYVVDLPNNLLATQVLLADADHFGRIVLAEWPRSIGCSPPSVTTWRKSLLDAPVAFARRARNVIAQAKFDTAPFDRRGTSSAGYPSGDRSPGHYGIGDRGCRISSSQINSARCRRRRASAGHAVVRSTSICASIRGSTIASGRSGWFK
jgi:hypothetical protein